ncbi:MAG: tetratricopeptide repeat protein [Candidatus Melainabacteria bacterium]|nr:tetratricopeptide repeat protein [Candidatus Melainabacteria bacterium]
MPTQQETERADAQKRADQFFNRKPKSEGDKALLYLQKYRPDLAISVYTRALVKAAKADLTKKENRQKAARLLTLIGRSFKLDENELVACFLYRTARKLDPEDTTNKAFLLESLIPSAQFAEATKLSKELDAIKSDNATILRALANQAMIVEDYDACCAYLERARKDKKDTLRYITPRLIGQCRIRQGIEAQVADLFHESGKLAESPYEKELAYGGSLLAAGKYADADEHFQRASHMLPDDIAWQSGRAQALCAMPNQQNAAFDQAIATAQKRRLTNRSMTMLANSLQGHGQPNDADRCLARLKALKPWSWHPYLAAARMVRSRGDNAGARKELAVAQRLNPRSGAIALEIAASYQCEGNLSEAINVCKKKLIDNPHFIQLWIKRGALALAMKDYAEAKASYQQALKLIPNESTLNVYWKNEAASAHAGLGTLAYMSGDKETATREARQFNELKFIPQLPAWLTIMILRPNRLSFTSTSKKEIEALNHTAVADMLMETRQLKDVVAEYAKAVELNPSDVDLHSYYLNALVENNNWVEAAKEDVIISNKLVSRAADSVAKWVKDKNAKKPPKAEPQGHKNGQGR